MRVRAANLIKLYYFSALEKCKPINSHLKVVNCRLGVYLLNVVIQFLSGVVSLTEMAGFTLFLLQLLALGPSTCLVSGHPPSSNFKHPEKKLRIGLYQYQKKLRIVFLGIQGKNSSEGTVIVAKFFCWSYAQS